MATQTKTSGFKVVLGYSAFAVVALIACFLLTFPYGALRARIATEGLKAGYVVRIDSLRPGLVGLTARNVKISSPTEPLSAETRAALLSGDPDQVKMIGAAELGEPLIIDSLFIRPSLFPLGAAFHAEVMGGELKGVSGGLKTQQLQVRLDGLDPSKGNLKGFSGLDLEGRLSGVINLTLPPGPAGANGKPGEPDLSLADGEFSLDGQNLKLNGSVPGVGVAGSGPVALLFPGGLPAVPMGEVQALIRFDKGQGTVETLRTRSDQLELQATGTLRLKQRLQYSEPAMDVRLRVEPELVKNLGTAGLGLSILPPDKDDPKFRAGRLSGSLGKLNFLPKR
ncbi:type II secretion system protein GspN [Hyalangium rubrum]|uniref:Type II secretion system protein GspN n=1 Tax=Hyalangium rubrum TaxID=3103134 RepID=A0ABU5GW95_9BACT|nr:type II secretion system protein GspN [Hyalangium sp. s54d21]MDY7225450.1 type II secretion system protein GspN [Hyalangium sp. s54d21]